MLPYLTLYNLQCNYWTLLDSSLDKLKLWLADFLKKRLGLGLTFVALMLQERNYFFMWKCGEWVKGAWGQKLVLQILPYILPVDSRVNRLWLGWVLSFTHFTNITDARKMDTNNVLGGFNHLLLRLPPPGHILPRAPCLAQIHKVSISLSGRD